MRGDRERGGEGVESVSFRIGRGLREVVTKAALAACALLGLVLESGRDLPEPLLVIIRLRGKTDAVVVRKLFRLALALIEFRRGVDVRIREIHRHLVSLVLKPGDAGACARTAATVNENPQEKLRIKNEE